MSLHQRSASLQVAFVVLFLVLTSEASWPCVSHMNTPSPSKGNARYTSVQKVVPLLRTSTPQLCKINRHWRHKDVRLCTICSQIFSVMCGVHPPLSKTILDALQPSLESLDSSQDVEQEVLGHRPKRSDVQTATEQRHRNDPSCPFPETLLFTDIGQRMFRRVTRIEPFHILLILVVL